MAELGAINSKTEIYDSSEIDTSTDLVHLGVAGEIAGITQELSPVATDKVLIEKTADSNNKFWAELGDLPGGSVELRIDGGRADSTYIAEQLIDGGGA